MQFPYWIECLRRTIAQDHTALGPHLKCSQISKLMREPFFWAGSKARRHTRTAKAKNMQKRAAEAGGAGGSTALNSFRCIKDIATSDQTVSSAGVPRPGAS